VRIENPEKKLWLEAETNGTALLASCQSKLSQKWNLINDTSGHLQIQSAHSGKCLGISEIRVLFTSSYGQAQKWENNVAEIEFDYGQTCADEAVVESICRTFMKLILNPFDRTFE